MFGVSIKRVSRVESCTLVFPSVELKRLKRFLDEVIEKAVEG